MEVFGQKDNNIFNNLKAHNVLKTLAVTFYVVRQNKNNITL